MLLTFYRCRTIWSKNPSTSKCLSKWIEKWKWHGLGIGHWYGVFSQDFCALSLLTKLTLGVMVVPDGALGTTVRINGNKLPCCSVIIYPFSNIFGRDQKCPIYFRYIRFKLLSQCISVSFSCIFISPLFIMHTHAFTCTHITATFTSTAVNESIIYLLFFVKIYSDIYCRQFKKLINLQFPNKNMLIVWTVHINRITGFCSTTVTAFTQPWTLLKGEKCDAWNVRYQTLTTIYHLKSSNNLSWHSVWPIVTRLCTLSKSLLIYPSQLGKKLQLLERISVPFFSLFKHHERHKGESES